MGRNWKHQRDDAGSLLAAIIVVTLGAVVCGFLVAAAASSTEFWLLPTIVALPVTFTIWMIWYRYSRPAPQRLSFWFALSRSYRDDDVPGEYVPRKVRNRDEQVSGTNRPITAAEAREIQQTSSNTWVPSRSGNRSA
ncbi:MAG: hypothetical protein Fues2KO_10930 [Fuerstiella sp.]